MHNLAHQQEVLKEALLVLLRVQYKVILLVSLELSLEDLKEHHLSVVKQEARLVELLEELLEVLQVEQQEHQ